MDELLRAVALAATLLQPPATLAPPMQAAKADAWFGSDKARHFWMSYATTAFSFAAVHALGEDGDAALTIAIPVGAIVGVGKETYDRRRGERFSARDLVADALGIAAAWLILREVR